MQPTTLNPYEQKLLKGWEEIYKKGQLTFWILLALKDGPKYMAEIKQFVASLTHETIIADDQSMYRALRRYETAEIIQPQTIPGKAGPERKVYELTEIGERILETFSQRNITPIFYQPSLQLLITNKRESSNEKN